MHGMRPSDLDVVECGAERGEDSLAADALIVCTGALPIQPPIDGLHGCSALGPAGGVHLLHSMGDTSS